ncbi:MAG: tetratricopeptide repeat protein [Bacteroidota bacterium]
MKTKLKKIATLLFISILAIISTKSIAQDLKATIRLTVSEQYEDASQAFQSLLKAQPTNGDIYFYYGENYLHEYFSDTIYGSAQAAANDALNLFKKGVEVDPTNPLCYVGLGKVALMQKDIVSAEKHFADAQAKFPSKTNKTSTITAEKQALTLAKIAEAYILVDKKKNIAKALPLLEKAVALDPKNAEIYLIYGDAFIENNDGSSAITQYKMAQELSPKSPSAKLRLGNLWIRARNWTEAIGYYKEAIDIDSTFAPAFLELAVLYSKANQADKALQYFKKYDQMSTNVSAKIKYVNVLMDSKKYDEALAKLNEISKTDTSRNDLNRAYAICYFETGKYDKALISSETFFKKTTPDKTKAIDYSYYGKALSKNNKDSIAVEKFKAAYNMDTTNYDILSDIAGSYNKLKKYKEAADYYELKISKPSEKSKISDYYKLGLVYYSLKNWVKADSSYANITRNKPDFMNGKSYYWRGLINSNLDTASITWQAKPYFEKYVEIVKNDSVKFAKDLVTCYDYLAYYYYKNADFCSALLYWQKIIALDPTNKKAKELIAQTKAENAKAIREKCPTFLQ